MLAGVLAPGMLAARTAMLLDTQIDLPARR
jgi:hypothetical protein